MGTPAPGIVPGSACSLCWGLGKTFGIGDTPRYMYVEVKDIVKAGDWIPADGGAANGKYTLTQDKDFPCTFQLPDLPFLVSVDFISNSTKFTVHNSVGVLTYFAQPSVKCASESSNEETSGFTGGTMEILGWSV